MLAVIQQIAPTLQMAVERGEAGLGGISRPGEVALGEEDPADGETENAPGKSAGAVPDLDGVGEPGANAAMNAAMISGSMRPARAPAQAWTTAAKS